MRRVSVVVVPEPILSRDGQLGVQHTHGVEGLHCWWECGQARKPPEQPQKHPSGRLHVGTQAPPDKYICLLFECQTADHTMTKLPPDLVRVLKSLTEVGGLQSCRAVAI